MSEIWLLAVGIAASPFPIIPAILLLFTQRARVTSAVFLAGWALGIATATTVFVLLAEVVDARDYAPTWVSWTRITLGLILIVVAGRRWLTRARSEPVPGWMQSIRTATPGRALGLGLLLSAANPKIVLLAAAAGLSIGSEDLAAATRLAWVVGFTLIASSTVAVPLLLHLVVGERVLAPLGVAKDWLQVNNAAIMCIVFTVIGVVLVGEGVNGL